MLPLAAIGAGLGLVGTIGNLFASGRANRRLNDLIKQDPSYQSSPYASQRLALAQQLLNARMPGAATQERNIYGTQANTLANIQRNATDSSQALALAAGTQGQTNQAFNQLGQQEAQDYYNRLSNLTGAQQGMIQEGDKVYQDQIRRFQDLASIRGAQTQNTSNAWQSVSNLGMGTMNFGLASGMNLFGNGSGGNSGYMQPSTYMPMANYGYPDTSKIQLPVITGRLPGQ